MRRGKAWSDEGSSIGPDRHARDVGSLDRYAMERWEVILHFMVGSPNAAVSQDLAHLLTQAGLMRRYTHTHTHTNTHGSDLYRHYHIRCHIQYIDLLDIDLIVIDIAVLLFFSDPGEAPCITSAGFQFLLLDTASQLWYFTLQYLNTAQVPIHSIMHKSIYSTVLDSC